mgnify:CR=1 FL=1
MSDTKNIRNIAIIAHVDHGKTTLVDELLKSGGTERENSQLAERAMDSMDLEKEKGITIKAKNTSVHWKDKTINIVDTPGHADFGAEVERVMKMVEGVLLLVDAHDGPQAQTRFVLKKAIAEGLKIIVVINKIDRPHSTPEKVQDLVLELLMELEASEDQFDAPFVYGSAKNGIMIKDLSDPQENMEPLFQMIMESIPEPVAMPDEPFKMLISNIDWDDYVGRVAVGKILSGSVKTSDRIFVAHRDGKKSRARVSKVFEFTSTGIKETPEGVAGNIIGLSGFEDIDIGETLMANEEDTALPFVEIDPATIQMQFAVNDGPLGGTEGKYVTSRQIWERLQKEMKSNISIHASESSKGGVFNVLARGSMQISVLVEMMRREGFELLVSRPDVVMKKDEEGKNLEPFENLWIEVPNECVGGVMKLLSERRGKTENMVQHNNTTTLEAVIPTRGIIGLEFEQINLTNGRGVMSHLFKEYGPYAGEIVVRRTGTLLSNNKACTTAYSLFALEDRGKLFVGAGIEVYEGMIIGENPRREDLPVNATKPKQLTNFRSNGDGKGIQLAPPMIFSLERSIEYIAGDEYVEVTPQNLRMRKKILRFEDRKRVQKQLKQLDESLA